MTNLIMLSTLQSIREAVERAESVLHDAQSLKSDHSPFSDKEDYVNDMKKLKQEWASEARQVSRLADHMMGIK